MLNRLLPVLMALLLAACGADGRDAGEAVAPQPSSAQWYSTWGTATYTSFPNGPLTQEDFSPNTGAFVANEAVEQSFRMMIHPTARGDRVRFRFSNVFGDRPLVIRHANVAMRALPTGPAIVEDSLVPVLFAGADEVVIPAGAEVLSDAVDFSHEFGEDLAVSFHVPGPSGPMSWHAEAFATQYMSQPNGGDVTTEASGLSFLNIDRGWFFLSGMDSQDLDMQAAGHRPFTIVAFGDSITDGFAGTPELNHRWPDFFAQRLQNAGLPVGVVNVGINSNSVTPARDPVITGLPGIVRFHRDVIARSGVRSVFVLLGTNDITSGVSAEAIYAGLLDLRDQAHAAGLCMVVSTILPRNDPEFPFGWNMAAHAPVREALNDMIMTGGDFDAVTDALSQALENPLLENQPNNALFVEGLHPNSLGMQMMAEAVPIEPLLPAPLGSCSR